MPDQWRERNIAEVLADFDSLPIQSQSRKDDLRPLIESAARTHWEWRMRFGMYVFLTPLILTVSVPVSVVAVFGDGRLRFGVMACLATLLLLLIWETVLYRVLAARVLFLMVAGLVAFQWVEAVRAPVGSGRNWPAATAFLWLFMVTLPVLAYVRGKCAAEMKVRCHPHDELLMTAVSTAGVIQRKRDEWRSAVFVREAHGSLENLAVRAQLSLTLKERIDPTDRALRRTLRLEALRIAESIRLLKLSLSTASGVDDVDRVVCSLINGIEAVGRADRQALLDGSPPLPAGMTRVRSAAARMLPGAVLVASAFLVPLIPQIAHDERTASTVMWTLLVTGVTWIVSASSEATGRVGDVLARALPFK
ncbi:hypothetical protein [Streptomyces antibioticus]|uniref:hypothetical protein n=1 Tax=Streptomyces antibioticus TaxID=1890 RepID=UPI0036D8473A